MRFYLDENLPVSFAAAARRLGVDVTTSREEGRNGTTDAEQLRWAADQGRCIVTRDRGDFELITTALQEQGLAHAGVLLVPATLRDREIGALARALAAYADAHERDLPRYTIDWLRRGA